MLDKIVFQNGTIVSKEYLNEVQKGSSFSSGTPREDYYTEPTASEHASWGIGQRDRLKDWEIADPRQDNETGVGRLAHDGVVLNSYNPTTLAKVWGPPAISETSVGSGVYGAWVEAGSIILTDGQPISWAIQFVQLLSGTEENYLYIDENGAREAIEAGETVTISVGSSLPSVSQPHVPLAKLTLNADGTALLTNEDGDVAGAGYVDLRPSLYIGNLNTYPQTLRNTSIINDSYSAKSWQRVITDTSGGSLIVSLPSAPQDSDRIAVVDISGTFDRFPVVIRPAEDTKINGSVDDWIINIKDAHVELFYHEATAEWKFEESPGGECTPILGTFLSCGGREFIGQRLPEECPDGAQIPVTFPNPSEGVYRYEPSSSKCYRDFYPSVAVYADGQGGLIRVQDAPRCDRSSSQVAAQVRNVIFVDPSIGDDSLSNRGFSSDSPFRTIERAVIEAVRESRRSGQYNDRYDRVLIELAPGDYYVDNSPGSNSIPGLTADAGLIQRTSSGFSVLSSERDGPNTVIFVDSLNPALTQPPRTFNLGRVLYSESGGVGNISRIEKESLNSSVWKVTMEYARGNFNTGDSIYTDNLALVNPISGGIIVPRGISINGVDLRKVRIRPMFVPELNPVVEEAQRERTSIFKVTGGSYISLMTFTDNPQYARSHNTVTSVSFASQSEIEGVESQTSYYSKLNSLFIQYDGWNTEGLEAIRAETTIVAPIYSTKNLRQTDSEENQTGVPEPDSREQVKISYPGPSKIGIQGSTSGQTSFDLPDINSTRSSSPYIFNCSVRSIFGLNGLHADGGLVGGFKSMVTANFTQVSLQTDPTCFNDQAYYLDPPINKEDGEGKQYRVCIADKFKYRHYGFRGSNDATIQIVSCFVIGNADHFISESGADLSITNSCSDFGDISLRGIGYKNRAFSQDEGIPAAGYFGTRLTQIIPPLPLRYSFEDGRKPTLVDNEINTSLVINYQKTLDYVIANAEGINAPSTIRIYFDNADKANQFSLNNPPSASIAAFGQFSYTKKKNDGSYVHAGGTARENRRRIYVSGFDELGNSILFTGEIQIVTESDDGFDKLDDRSKVFAWDSAKNSWYMKIRTLDVVEEFNDDDGDGYLLKRFDYAFRYKLFPGRDGTPLTYEALNFIFDRSGIKIVRAVDTRKNDDRVYRVILSGYRKEFGIRKPQSYYVLEKQSSSAGYPLNGSAELAEDPLTVTQITTLDRVLRPNSVDQLFPGDFVTYLTNSSNARGVFTGEVFPDVDADEPELTEDPEESITKIALKLMAERQGVFLTAPIVPSTSRIDVKLRANSTGTGILIGLRRPSIIRASGHTWEWTGYLNYDTAFPKFQGDPLEQDFALGKIIVEENGGRVYATGMNEEGSYYIGTTVFDLRSGEQFAIPLKADTEPGNITNQVLNNVIVKNTLLMGDDSSIFFQTGTRLVLSNDTEIVSNTGAITPTSNTKSYATTDYAGLLQLAKPEEVRGAFNAQNKGVSARVAVSAFDLANELNIRLENNLSAGTGVTISSQKVDLPGGDPNDSADDITQFSISIGQPVATDSDVTFNTVTAAADICAFSDARLKDEVVSLSESLAKVEGLRGVSYRLKSDPGRTRLGLIAQEVEQVTPEVVNYDPEKDIYSVSYHSLVPVLIEAIKELSTRVRTLEDKI